MKRFISILMMLCMVFTLAACGGGNEPAAANPPVENDGTAPEGNGDATEPEGDADPVADAVGDVASFPGKIAIITNTVSQNEEEYQSARSVVNKYGEDKVIHQTWPDNFMAEQEQMVSIVSRIASDPEVKALIINQAVPGSNAAVDKLLEVRDDMFILYCTPQENPPDVMNRANLVLMPDELEMGRTIAEQAKVLGAETLVHYSFPRHMSQVLLSSRREIMREKCEELGIQFVDATAPDPTSDAGNTGAQQFILEDVPKMVAEYGKDTAFFSTNCVMQVPLITASVAEGAIYPQPCCPSPYHGFPSALGIESSGEFDDTEYIMAESRRILEEKGVAGRFSTWPVPAAIMSTIAGAEYAVKWINGEVQQEGIDLAVLEACMSEFAGVPVSLTTYEEDGQEVTDFMMFLMDYVTY